MGSRSNGQRLSFDVRVASYINIVVFFIESRYATVSTEWMFSFGEGRRSHLSLNPE